MGCDLGSAICSTTCSGTKKGNFLSCSCGLFSSINRYINWDCKKFSQNGQNKMHLIIIRKYYQLFNSCFRQYFFHFAAINICKDDMMLVLGK